MHELQLRLSSPAGELDGSAANSMRAELRTAIRTELAEVRATFAPAMPDAMARSTLTAR